MSKIKKLEERIKTLEERVKELLDDKQKELDFLNPPTMRGGKR